MQVPTVKIKHLDKFLIINQADYNENIHELYEDWVTKDTKEYIPPHSQNFQNKFELINYAQSKFGVTLDKRKTFTNLLKVIQGLEKLQGV
jgi:hypothetical protein